MNCKTVTLWRPVGQSELDLIENTGRFPPRKPEQPFFYPVCNREYAELIAHNWNAQYEGIGHVVQFEINKQYISNYTTHTVGSSVCEEYWIPADQLETFNQNIVGPIYKISTFVKET